MLPSRNVRSGLNCFLREWTAFPIVNGEATAWRFRADRQRPVSLLSTDVRVCRNNKKALGLGRGLLPLSRGEYLYCHSAASAVTSQGAFHQPVPLTADAWLRHADAH